MECKGFAGEGGGDQLSECHLPTKIHDFDPKHLIYLFIHLFILHLPQKMNITERKRKNIYLTKIANL